MQSISGGSRDHDQTQLSSHRRFGRLNSSDFLTKARQQVKARQYQSTFLLVVVAAVGVRNLVVRQHGANQPTVSDQDNAAGDHGEATGFKDPQVKTIQQVGVRQLLLSLIAIISVAGAGVLIIRWNDTDTPSSKLFVSTNQFGEWAAIVAVVSGISVAVAIFTLPPFRRVKQGIGAATFWWAFVMYALIGAVAVAGPFLVEGSGNSSFELSHFNLRIGLIAALILITGIGPFCGLILLVHRQRIFVEDPGTAAGSSISDILSARRDLQLFFVGAATLITGTMVLIGGLQSALNAYNTAYDNASTTITIGATDNPVNISVGALILYGLFFAGLLAVVLAPSYTAWQKRALSFRDCLYPIPENGRPPKNWYEARSALEGLLGTSLGARSRFLAVTGVLAPLIGTIITVIIPVIHGL